MRDTPSETIKNTIMPELLLVIYLTLFNLLFKGVCWIVLTLFRIALFIFRWTIEIIIYASASFIVSFPRWLHGDGERDLRTIAPGILGS